MYKVIKKFFDPLSKTRKIVGDMIDIPEKFLDSYIGYVEIPGNVQSIETAVKVPTIDEAIAAPAIKIIEKRKPKKK